MNYKNVIFTPSNVSSGKYTKEQKLMDTDMVGGLVGEVVPDYSCIVFCPTRRNCETLSELICRILPKEITKVSITFWAC